MKNKILIIAEISANHNNDLNLTKKTIEAIKKSGADAVKIQTYKPDSLTLKLNDGYFKPRTKGLWKGYTPWELYSEASLPYEWHLEIKELCDKNNLIFFSSPFDKEAVDFLENLDVPYYKIASLEITDIPLIGYTASKGKPMIISTGVAETKDIHEAIKICKKNNNDDITLLKCTSEYPASISEANLISLIDIKERFNVKVGISDHTLGSVVPITAVSMGISVIEKHFTLSRDNGGVDASFSMEPDEFAEMVKNVRLAESSIGKVDYKVSYENKMRRRSLFVVEDIKEGELFTNKNIRSIRPGYGLCPKYFDDIINKRAKTSLKTGTPLSFEHIDKK
tara:strand:+ start:14322 stop:15332 length:1011 start_codon:yes stop_codon:yes gene_type:complete